MRTSVCFCYTQYAHDERDHYNITYEEGAAAAPHSGPCSGVAARCGVVGKTRSKNSCAKRRKAKKRAHTT